MVMKITVLTLFPEMFTALSASILGRAQREGKVEFEIVNLRDHTQDKHLKCDDYPFGGGAGMVMMAQPIGSAIEALDPEHKARRIYLSPKGEVFRQQKVFELVEYEHIILLCGHYEGVDQRAVDLFIDEELSIGDYVLTGGELPAMVMVDAISRMVPGVLHNDVSAEFESFQDNLLEYPQYSRPEEWHGKKVPPVLLSGHHANIEKWRRQQSILRTKERRPDLLAKCELTQKEKEWLEEISGYCEQ